MGHKCFISFKGEDCVYKKYIQDELKINMVDKSLNEPIDSNDEDYIMQKIREDYLSDSTVTIFLIGAYSSENLGWREQRYIKRELQASQYNGKGNSRSGILGVVLPSIEQEIYRGTINCYQCNGTHNCVALNDNTVISEFRYNYHIPNGKCYHTEDDRYCVLVKWSDFCINSEKYIEVAFNKRFAPIASKIRVYNISD
jgi:hypothetical protein